MLDKYSYQMNYIQRGFIHHRSFHLPKDVGPFHVKYLSALQYMEDFLEKLSLEKVEIVAYDPHIQKILKISLLLKLLMILPGCTNLTTLVIT